ncbi:PAS domain-containing protein [Caminibacter pacificus]
MNKRYIIDEEVRFEDVNPTNRPVVSRTDIHGNILYVNSVFANMCGYKKEEMLGRPHRIIRHPDMPKKVFEEMWETIKAGKEWQGFVKNLRKDGRYYWVDAHISPVKKNGKIVGYISVRRAVNDDIKREMERMYAEMKENERSF